MYKLIVLWFLIALAMPSHLRASDMQNTTMYFPPGKVTYVNYVTVDCEEDFDEYDIHTLGLYNTGTTYPTLDSQAIAELHGDGFPRPSPCNNGDDWGYTHSVQGNSTNGCNSYCNVSVHPGLFFSYRRDEPIFVAHFEEQRYETSHQVNRYFKQCFPAISKVS